jgi:peptidoglycan/LPS O-acetylase OafA/YrhL
LYPLHLAMLLLFIVAQGARVALLPDSPHYVGPVPTAAAFLANLLMVQWVNLDAYGVWNHPSWTIGVEFYTYLLFALAVVVLRKRFGLIALLALLIGVPVIAWIHGYQAVYDLYLLRGGYGFAWGVAAWNLHHALPRQSFSTPWECIAAAAVIVFTSIAGGTGWVLAGPALFALTTFVFSGETGAVSRALCSRPLLLCGLCSYSIYMTHAFVASVILRLAQGSGQSAAWLGDALLLPYVACTFLASLAAFRFIEQPSRDLVRARINKKAVAT